MRRAAAVFMLLMFVAARSTAGSQAARIDSISPVSARVGEQVTITGIGFGGPNLRITVGGVAAKIVSATGNSATFVVPSGLTPGPTPVDATQPGGHIGSIAFKFLEGVLLPGNSFTPVKDAGLNIGPISAQPGDIDNGLILTRLVLRLKTTAMAIDVNSALEKVDGGVVSIEPGFLTLTIAVPRQSLAELNALRATLQTLPGVAFASLAEVPRVRDIPAGADLLDLSHLLPTRFPAAWNARKLVDGCPGGNVPVVVMDHFAANKPSDFDSQIPPANISYPEGTGGTGSHGYDVVATLGALFDADLPTGANPFTQCLTFIAIDGSADPYSDFIRKVKRHFPAGKFILNNSTGYVDDVPVDLLPAIVTDPLDRALDAIDWKQFTMGFWSDFVATNSAGNEANRPATAVYAGLGQAAFDNPINVAAKNDPLFAFVQDATFWSDLRVPSSLPSIAASAGDTAQLQSFVTSLQLDHAVPDNVLVTGSASTALGTQESFEEMTATPSSDLGADVKAIGEAISALGPRVINGTSFAAPQVAGLASYLWLLSPTLRGMPSAATIGAIRANARNTPQAGAVIDAYATVLSLDPVQLCTSNPCVRLALLDVNNNGSFEENDVENFLRRYYQLDANGNLTTSEVSPLNPDYGRFDLNGDGFTGGKGTERFDLDRTGSTQFGTTIYTTATQTIEDDTVSFDETAVTDVQVLCYFAYSPLYTGDTTQRTKLLAGRCKPLTVTVTPSPVTLTAGATQQFVATVVGAADPTVKWTATCGSIDPNTGFYTAPLSGGPCTVRATSVANGTTFGEATVTLHASGGHFGVNAFWNATIAAQFGTSLLFPPQQIGFSNPQHSSTHATLTTSPDPFPATLAVDGFGNVTFGNFHLIATGTGPAADEDNLSFADGSGSFSATLTCNANIQNVTPGPGTTIVAPSNIANTTYDGGFYIESVPASGMTVTLNGNLALTGTLNPLGQDGGSVSISWRSGGVTQPDIGFNVFAGNPTAVVNQTLHLAAPGDLTVRVDLQRSCRGTQNTAGTLNLSYGMQ